MNYDDAKFAKATAAGFVELLDAAHMNGTHFIRAAHITAVRPVWNDDDEWVGCDVYTLDGTKRLVNASFEQIAAAIDAATGNVAPVAEG